jgi:hypothetical protein
MNIVTCDSTVTREIRLRLWVELLEHPIEEVGVIDAVEAVQRVGDRQPLFLLPPNAS